MTLTMVSHSALAVDFYCRYKLANDATDGISPINLIRVDLETKTGTQYSTIREEADYKIIAVKEHPLKEMRVTDTYVAFKSGYFYGREAWINRYTLLLKTDGPRPTNECKVIDNLDEQLELLRAEAEKNVAERRAF